MIKWNKAKNVIRSYDILVHITHYIMRTKPCYNPTPKFAYLEYFHSCVYWPWLTVLTLVTLTEVPVLPLIATTLDLLYLALMMQATTPMIIRREMTPPIIPDSEPLKTNTEKKRLVGMFLFNTWKSRKPSMYLFICLYNLFHSYSFYYANTKFSVIDCIS